MERGREGRGREGRGRGKTRGETNSSDFSGLIITVRSSSFQLIFPSNPQVTSHAHFHLHTHTLYSYPSFSPLLGRYLPWNQGLSSNLFRGDKIHQKEQLFNPRLFPFQQPFHEPLTASKTQTKRKKKWPITNRGRNLSGRNSRDHVKQEKQKQFKVQAHLRTYQLLIPRWSDCLQQTKQNNTKSSSPRIQPDSKDQPLAKKWRHCKPGGSHDLLKSPRGGSVDS